MNDPDATGFNRRSLIKSLGVGAAAGLAGCSLLNRGGGGQALLWEYGFPNTDGAEPVWRNEFEANYEERAGESIEIARYAYEDLRQNFLTGAQTGDPDAIEGTLNHMGEYMAGDNLQPLDDLADSLEHFDGYLDSAIDAMTYQDTLYGLPYEGNARALFVRQDVLDELGQDAPETAEEFQQLGRLINQEYDDMTAFHNCTMSGGARSFQEWMTHVYQHTDQLYVPNGDSWSLNIDADSLGQVFDNWYYQIYAADDPIGDPDDLGTGWQTNDPGYINGNYAMVPGGTWMRNWTSGENIQNSDEAADILNNRTQIVHPPYGEGASRGTFLEIKPVMVNAHADNLENGEAAAAAYSDPETLNQGMGQDPEASGKAMTPVHEDVESTIENENWQPFTEIFETGRALAKVTWGPVREEFYTVMQEVAYGETDPYDAGDSFHETLQGLESEL